MKRIPAARFPWTFLLVPAVLAACGERAPAPPPPNPPPTVATPEPAPAPARPHRHPPLEFRIQQDSTDDDSLALRSFAGQILEAARGGQVEFLALLHTILLDDPGAWLARVFGPEEGKRLLGLHEAGLPHFDQDVSLAFRRMVEAGLTEIHVYRLADAADPRANEMQKAAFRAMKEPVALFTVDFKHPDSPLGRSIFNWVKVDGGFKLIGMLPGMP